MDRRSLKYESESVLLLQRRQHNVENKQSDSIKVNVAGCFEGSQGRGFTCSATIQARVLSDSLKSLRVGKDYVLKVFDPAIASTIRSSYGLTPTITEEGIQAMHKMLLGGKLHEFRMWYSSEVDKEAIRQSTMQDFLKSYLGREPITHRDVVIACCDNPEARAALINCGAMCDWTTEIQEAVVYLDMVHAFNIEAAAFEVTEVTNLGHTFPQMLTSAWLSVSYGNIEDCEQGYRSISTMEIPVIIMEMINGHTLESLSGQKTISSSVSKQSKQDLQPRNKEDYSSLFRDAQSLAFDLYNMGLFHEDLRASNLMISRRAIDDRLHLTVIDIGSLRPDNLRWTNASRSIESAVHSLQSAYTTSSSPGDPFPEVKDIETDILTLLASWLSKDVQAVQACQSCATGRFRVLKRLEDTLSWRIIMEDVLDYLLYRGSETAEIIKDLQHLRDIMLYHIQSAGESSWTVSAIKGVCTDVLKIKYDCEIQLNFRRVYSLALQMFKESVTSDDELKPYLMPQGVVNAALAGNPIFHHHHARKNFEDSGQALQLSKFLWKPSKQHNNLSLPESARETSVLDIKQSHAFQAG